MANHQFEIIGMKRVCVKCLRTAHEISRSRLSCPGVPWYKSGQAPPHLFTRSQLKARGLQPAPDQQPAGMVLTVIAHQVVDLYDLAQAQPRRGDTAARRAARAAVWAKTARKWQCTHCGRQPANIGELTNWWHSPGLCQGCQDRLKWEKQQAEQFAQFERDRREVCQWAADLLRRSDWAIIDCETSGLYGAVLEVGIIAPDGRTLYHSLVHPDSISIEEGARLVHGISDEELAHAPRLDAIWDELRTSIAHCTTLIAYNVDFDRARIEQSADSYHLPVLTQEWQCAMQAYSAYCGEWSSYHRSYRWQKLPGAGHRALDDARATLALIWKMAEQGRHTASEQPQQQDEDAHDERISGESPRTAAQNLAGG